MTLMKSPYEIKLDNERLSDVLEFKYIDGKLYIDFLPTNFEMANKLLSKIKVKQVLLLPVGESRVSYSISGYHKASMFISKSSVVIIRLEFNVLRVWLS